MSSKQLKWNLNLETGLPNKDLRELVLNGQVLADFVKVFIEYSAPKSTPVYEKILWRDDDDVD